MAGERQGVERRKTFLTCWLYSQVFLLWLVGGVCALSAVPTPVVLRFILCSMVAPCLPLESIFLWPWATVDGVFFLSVSPRDCTT